ncbi:MAG: 2-oxo-3-hexenedioate decarboxylase [Limisphaerales bacterium]|jgi:2-oxo-3-hexenedioate decarboxylase
MTDHKELAKLLDVAAKNAKAIAQLSLAHSFTEKEAYEIQRLSIEERYARGEKLIGIKMGFTSRAKMEQMGVHDMIWGRLTNDMKIMHGTETSMSRYIHPRAEPEICFRVSRTIDHALGMDEVLEYIDGIAPAIEIIDSRYENFKFSLEDVIADNCSSTGFVVGKWSQASVSVLDLKMDLIIDGEVAQSGSSNQILGNPWESVTEASRLCAQYGQEIPAGSYLMAGASTPAVFIKAGQDVEVNVASLGSAKFHIS